jgi:hypothetical protein
LLIFQLNKFNNNNINLIYKVSIDSHKSLIYINVGAIIIISILFFIELKIGLTPSKIFYYYADYKVFVIKSIYNLVLIITLIILLFLKVFKKRFTFFISFTILIFLFFEKTMNSLRGVLIFDVNANNFDLGTNIYLCFTYLFILIFLLFQIKKIRLNENYFFLKVNEKEYVANIVIMSICLFLYLKTVTFNMHSLEMLKFRLTVFIELSIFLFLFILIFKKVIAAAHFFNIIFIIFSFNTILDFISRAGGSDPWGLFYIIFLPAIIFLLLSSFILGRFSYKRFQLRKKEEINCVS